MKVAFQSKLLPLKRAGKIIAQGGDWETYQVSDLSPIEVNYANHHQSEYDYYDLVLGIAFRMIRLPE